jgi:predicted nucleic acid-binding protein
MSYGSMKALTSSEIRRIVRTERIERKDRFRTKDGNAMMVPPHPRELDRLIGERQARLRRAGAPRRTIALRFRIGRLLIAAGASLSGERVERLERPTRPGRPAVCTPDRA